MKNKKNALVSTIVLLIYIITILLYTSSLIFEYATGPKRIENRFNCISRELSINARNNDVNSQAFSDGIINSIGTFSDIEKLQVKVDGQLVCSYPNYDFSEHNKKSSLVKTKTDFFVTSDNRQITLNAAFYLLKPKSIFNKGLVAFLVILFTTLVLVIYILVNSKNNPEKEDTTELQNEDTSAQTEETSIEEENSITEDSDFNEIEISDELSEPDVSEEIYENTKTPDEILSESPLSFDLTESAETTENTQEKTDAEIEETIEQNISSQMENYNEQKEITFTQEEMEVLSQITSELKKEAEEEQAAEVSSKPEGLFCPATNFGWEAYMMPRLDSELIRAASSETDLSLLILKIPGIDWTTDYAHSISDKVIETAQFNDLVFNYQEDGCIMIIQNTNTDKAIEIAQKLLLAIKNILKENNAEDKAVIGISTRSLRLISGNRLLNETEQAVIHAEEDVDSPVVAFRVNPDKYRNYMASSDDSN